MENSLYSEITEDVGPHFERNEQLDSLRSGLHVKAVKLLQELTGLEKDEPPRGTSLEQRGMLQLLNYLIVDYFSWFGYKNTLKTFAIETGEKSKPKPREKLQRELNIENADLPILLHMLLKESKRNNDNLMHRNKWEHMPMKVEAQSKKLKKTQVRNSLVKKVNKPSDGVEAHDLLAETKLPRKEIKVEPSTTKKGTPAKKMPSKVKFLPEPSILIADMPAKEASVRKRVLCNQRDIPAKKKPNTVDFLVDSRTTLKYIPNKEPPKKVENLYQQGDIKVPQSKVNVRQSIAETDTQRPRSRAR